MLSTRDDLVTEPIEIVQRTQTSVLNLPQEIIRDIIPAAVNANHDSASNEATSIMRKLSQTNHTLHTLFKPELDKRISSLTLSTRRTGIKIQCMVLHYVDHYHNFLVGFI